MKYLNTVITLLGFLLIVSTLAGCGDSKSRDDDEFFIRVGDSVITVSDFNRAFEIAKASYSHSAMRQAENAREAKLRFVKQMTEEMLLLEKAKDMGIKITEAEIKKAVEDIKQSYPENEFDQVLLEYAVPYPSWEKRLEARLLMEKVIAKELGNRIVVTPDDISKYYKTHHKDDNLTADMKKGSEDVNEEAVINYLRRKKIEEAYTPWIKKLQKEYIIEINEIQWEKIIGA